MADTMWMWKYGKISHTDNVLSTKPNLVSLNYSTCKCKLFSFSFLNIRAFKSGFSGLTTIMTCTQRFCLYTNKKWHALKTPAASSLPLREYRAPWWSTRGFQWSLRWAWRYEGGRTDASSLRGGTNTHSSTHSSSRVRWVTGCLYVKLTDAVHHSVALHASCRNFSLTLSDVQFLQVLMATCRPGLS